MALSLDNRTFAILTNSDSGDARPGETTFRFSQKERAIWAHYSGGRVVHGTWVGVWQDDETFLLRYLHVTTAGVIKHGSGTARVHARPDGRHEIREHWSSTDGVASGDATFEEQLPL